MSVEEIIESLQDSTDVISVDDDEIGEYETDDDECLQKPTTADVRNAIDTLMDLSLFVESDGISSSIVNVSKLIEKELSSHYSRLLPQRLKSGTCYHSDRRCESNKLLLKLAVSYFTISGAFAPFISAFRGYFAIIAFFWRN